MARPSRKAVTRRQEEPPADPDPGAGASSARWALGLAAVALVAASTGA